MSVLKKIPDTLLALLPDKVYHFKAVGASYPYVVWAEESPGASLNADNVHAELIMTGSVRYYTRDEYDTTVDDIQAALDAAGIANRLTQILYDPDEDIIEYWWDWSVSCGAGEIYR